MFMRVRNLQSRDESWDTFAPSMGSFWSTSPGRCPGHFTDIRVGGRASSSQVQLQRSWDEHCTVQSATSVQQNGYTVPLEDKTHVRLLPMPWLGAEWALSPSSVWEAWCLHHLPAYSEQGCSCSSTSIPRLAALSLKKSFLKWESTPP